MDAAHEHFDERSGIKRAFGGIVATGLRSPHTGAFEAASLDA
jgi:hypothetical protein